MSYLFSVLSRFKYDNAKPQSNSKLDKDSVQIIREICLLWKPLKSDGFRQVLYKRL